MDSRGVRMEWIGTGWCAQEGPWDLSTDDEGYPILTKIESVRNPGIRRKLPHLGNAGKGVNRPISQGDYEQRKEYICSMLYEIRDRLVDVRIICGDWARVLTPSVM